MAAILNVLNTVLGFAYDHILSITMMVAFNFCCGTAVSNAKLTF